MKRTAGIALVLAATLVASVLALSATADKSSAAPAASVAACTNVKLGFEGPLTGPAGFLGQEQVTWAQLAVADFNKKYKTRFAVKKGDTGLDPAVARTVGQRDISDKKVLVVIGPSTSGAVQATGNLFEAARLAAISPSATKIELTNGQFKTFFRVIPNDLFQGKSDVNYMVKVLKVKRVMVVSSQEPYGEALAGIVFEGLKAAGVTVDRDSVDPAKETDFGPIATKVKTGTNVVFTPWQVATAAQTLSQQLLQQGKSARVFGTDGTFDPSHFKPSRGYVSSFAPDIHGLKSAKPLIARYNKRFHKSFGTFGPPSYAASWLAMTAIRNACKDGKTNRAEVVGAVARAKIRAPWGNVIQFNGAGDVKGGKSYVFTITNGVYKYVGSF